MVGFLIRIEIIHLEGRLRLADLPMRLSTARFHGYNWGRHLLPREGTPPLETFSTAVPGIIAGAKKTPIAILYLLYSIYWHTNKRERI